jgi:hypothetical protein
MLEYQEVVTAVFALLLSTCISVVLDSLSVLGLYEVNSRVAQTTFSF